MLREICDVFKEAYRRGWITTRDGNASYRRPGDDFFYVTPSAVRKNEMIPDMCIKLDIDQTGWSRDRWSAADEGMLKQTLNRGLKPTGELPMHWALQRDLSLTEHSRVVLHLHPTHVIAATRYLLEKVGSATHIMTLAQDFPEIFRYTRVGQIVEYVEPISQALADAVETAMLEPLGPKLLCDVIAMDRHGAVSVGSDPWEAFEHIERLNHVCEIFLLSK
jgi:L-fuculose-phosphate aldolase